VRRGSGARECREGAGAVGGRYRSGFIVTGTALSATTYVLWCLDVAAPPHSIIGREEALAGSMVLHHKVADEFKSHLFLGQSTSHELGHL
jgi:hypothetical protein